MLLKFLLLFLLVLTGCEKKNSTNSFKQVLRLNLIDDPSSLDPRIVRSIKDLTLMKHLFEGLMRIDQMGAPQLALAKKVDVSEDLLTYTFHLREAYWNNKERVTAYDFEYAWTKVLEPSFASDYAYMLFPIKNAQKVREGRCTIEHVGIVAQDEDTLVVHLESPTPYFLDLVAFPTYFPINRYVDQTHKSWASPPGNDFVCNGPFYLKKWLPQRDLCLEKNPLYWDCQSVHIEEITFSVIADNHTQFLLFDKNELDWLGPPFSQNIGTDILSRIKETDVLNSYTVAGTFWLKFNVEKEPFNQEKVRRAFSYAINRQNIITHILQGHQSIATGACPPSITKKQRIYFEDGAAQKAKKLLEESLTDTGWTIQTLPPIILSYSISERNTKIVQLLQEQWQEAFGIKVELVAMESHLYKRNLNQGLFQIGTGDWIADFNDRLAFLELFKFRNDSTVGNGMNETGWHNATFTSLLEQSLTEKNSEKRDMLLEQAEEILVREMPIAPVYHYSFDYLKKPHLKNVILSPLGFVDFKNAINVYQTTSK